MKVFQWQDSHIYVGIAETVEEARRQIAVKIRDYHSEPDGGPYSANHEREISGEPHKVYDLPCGLMIVDYSG